MIYSEAESKIQERFFYPEIAAVAFFREMKEPSFSKQYRPYHPPLFESNTDDDQTDGLKNLLHDLDKIDKIVPFHLNLHTIWAYELILNSFQMSPIMQKSIK